MIMKPELRVFLLENCIINPPPRPPQPPAALAIPLLGLFAPKLIEMAIGGVAALLKKAGEDKVTRAPGVEFADFYQADDKQALTINKKLGCVLALWGTFPGEDGHQTPASDTVVRKLEDALLIPKNSQVELIFEAQIRPSLDSTAFFLDTRHFHLRDFVADSGKSERGLVATLSVSTPGASAVGDTIAIGNIDFGKLKKGANLVPMGHPQDAYPRYRSNLMPWKQITQAAKAAYDADVTAKQAAGRFYMPVTFSVTISETSEGNDWLVKLGELLDGEKKAAASEISKLILPEERAKAEADRAEAAEKLYAAELDAEIELRKAQKAYDDAQPGDKPVKAAELEKAKRKLARQKALREAAGLPDRGPVPPQ